MDDKILEYLIYYASEYRKEFPKSLEAVIPQGTLINEIAKYGLMGAVTRNKINEAIYQKWISAIQTIGSYGQSKEKDYCDLVYHLAINYVNQYSKNLSFEEQKTILEEAIHFADSYKTITMVSRFNKPFNELEDRGSERLYTWTPLDMMFTSTENGIEESGLTPCSLITMQSFSGSGKSFLTLGLAHQMKKKKVASEIWYLSTEMGEGQIKRRLRNLPQTYFDNSDRVLGGWTTDMLLNEIMKNPNPTRLIVLDGIDSAPETLKGRDTVAYLAYLSNASEIAHRSLFVFMTGQFNRIGKAAVASGDDPEVTHAAGSVEKENISDIFMSVVNRTKIDNQKPINNTSKFDYYIHKSRHFSPDITRWSCDFNFHTFEFGKDGMGIPEPLGW